MDSDTENSILIEHDKNKKLVCLKDTPLKLDSGKKVDVQSDENMSASDDDDSAGDDEDTGKSGDDEDAEEEEEPDEDQMVMSRATRMSIMGVIPKDNDSDESDFIQSDEVRIMPISWASDLKYVAPLDVNDEVKIGPVHVH